MREAGADEGAADITDAHLRARVVQQRVMWAGALVALTVAGILAVIVVTAHAGPRATVTDVPAGGFPHIWSVSSVARR